jgi:hypothetical protein
MPTIREPSRPTDPVDRLIFGALTSSRSTVLGCGTLQIQSIREYPEAASSPDWAALLTFPGFAASAQARDSTRATSPLIEV